MDYFPTPLWPTDIYAADVSVRYASNWTFSAVVLASHSHCFGKRCLMEAHFNSIHRIVPRNGHWPMRSHNSRTTGFEDYAMRKKGSAPRKSSRSCDSHITVASSIIVMHHLWQFSCNSAQPSFLHWPARHSQSWSLNAPFSSVYSGSLLMTESHTFEMACLNDKFCWTSVTSRFRNVILLYIEAMVSISKGNSPFLISIMHKFE